MSPRDGHRASGAQPEIELAIMESDVHHLREQLDRDRRGFAERMSDLRNWRERIEATQAAQTAQLARAADALDRLEVGRKADALQLADLVALTNRGRGAFWVIAGLAGLGGIGTALQLARMFLGAH